jgi:hypothetical protein
MPAIRPTLLGVGTMILAAFGMGCATVSMAVANGAGGETPLNPASGPPKTWQTTVANLPGEDLAGPCHYSLYTANSAATLRGVLVIYDRADSAALFEESGVRSLVGSLNLGLLFPQQCNAASFDDIQQNAFAGPGRALFTALDQFATQASHAELAKSDVILFGFSAAGVLAATTANYRPSRVIGVIDYAGASAQQAMNDVVPSAPALPIPFLVLSNDEDPRAGTARDQMFFAEGWLHGAPWGRAVQHGVGHCCAISTKPLIVPWIEAVTALRLDGSNQLANVPSAIGVFTNYTCTPNGIRDGTGYEDCTFTTASLIPDGSSTASAQGWLPDAATGAAWMTWVGQ